MADLISLGIKVTNDGITATSTALDKLAASADRAGAAVDKLPKNLSTADTSAKAATKSSADLTSTLDKASFGDAKIYKANQSLNKFKQALQDANNAASKSTGFSGGLSDAALTKANAGLSSYKAGLDAVRASSEAAANADAASASRISDMVKASLARVEAEKAVASASKGTEAANAAQAASTQALIAAQNRAMSASTALANAAKTNDFATKQKDDLAKLVGQIDPTVAALNKLDAQQEKLNAFKKSGALSADDFKTYSAAIDQARLKVTGAAGAVEKFTFNSAASRREFGLLAKDLATGQVGNFERSALTLANTSGVLGAAFSVTGLAVAGLTAVLGGLVAAYVVGSGETTEFSKAIILTGNAAGLTTDQYADMAKAIGDTGVGQHAAAEALAQVASTGTFTASQIGEVTKAAVELEHVGGQAVADTVKQFAKLAEDPVKASADLNKQYGYLTASIYDQIKALNDQGDATAAADLAVKAYADSINERTPQIQQNLGYVQRGWVAVKGAVIDATNAVLDFGRNSTASENIAKLQSQIANGNRLIASGSLGAFDVNRVKQDVAKYTDQLVQLQADSAQKEGAAAAQGAQTVFNKRYAQYGEEATKYQSETSKLQTQIAANQKEGDDLYNKAIAAGNTEAAKQIKARQTLIDQGLKSRLPKGKSGASVDNAENSAQLQEFKDSLEATTAAFTDQQKVLDAKRKGDLISQADYYTQSEKLAQDSADAQVAAINKEIAVLQARTVSGVAAVNNQKKIAELQADASKIEADATQKVTLLQIEQQGEVQKTTAAINSYIDALKAQTAARQDEVDAQVASIGMGDKEYSRLQDLNKITQEAAKQQLSLAKAKAADPANADKYDAETKALQDATDQRVQIEKDGFDKIDAAQANWANGANKAFQDFSDAANNTAENTRKVFSDAFDGIAENLADLAVDGTSDFKGLLKNLEKEIISSAIKKELADMLSPLFGNGAKSGGSGANAGSLLSSFSGSGSSGSLSDLFSGDFLGFAKGGAFNQDGLAKFANGGVVSQPTFFGFGNSRIGVMGEAGDEGILPLRRGPNGQLGVINHAANDSSGPRNTTINNTTVVQGLLDNRTTDQVAATNGREISRAIRRSG